MKKKLFLVISLCFLTTSFTQAASLHGDFEGNPIVAVKSGGQDLKIEDVPAINYKDRTMVPIYLLRQLGAEVTWNNDSYSVNVAIPNQAASDSVDPEVKNHLILKNTYQILSDVDYSMWMFVDKLQFYSSVDNPSNYLTQLDKEYLNLSSQYNESLQLVLKLIQTVKSNQLDSIMKSQANAIKELTLSKDLLVALIKNKDNPEVISNFKINLLNCLRTLQQNIDNTKKIQHELLLQEIDVALK